MMGIMMLLKCTVVLLVLMVNEVTFSAGTPPPFGSCPPGKEKCSECYLALKESLLSKDGNIQNLSVAFYPPRADKPEFVTVKYHIDNGSSQLWFWTHDSSYLFFPLKTFQYLSLFFGKLETHVTKSVSLTLDADCQDAKPENMMLLTQRLKDFVQRKKYNPEIDENYFAKSEQSTDDILTVPVAKYIIAFYAAGFGLIVLTAVVLIVTYLYTKRWDKKLKKLSHATNTNKHSQSKIFGVAMIGTIMNIYIFILDVLAELTLDDEDLIVPEKKLVSLPHIVLGVGGLALLICTSFWVLSLCSLCKYRWFGSILNNMEYLFLALSMLGPILSLVIHLPYVAIAFLNDAYHASSVLITYIVIAFMLFGAAELTYGTCQGALIASKHGELKFNEIFIPEGISLVWNQVDDQERVRRETSRKLTVENGNIQFTYFSINEEQQVRILSTELSPGFIADLQGANNPMLTLDFRQNPDEIEGDALVEPITIICTLKSSNDDEQSKVELQVPHNIQLEVQNVDTNNNLINFGENNILNIAGGTLLRQTLHCCPRCTKSRIGIILLFLFTIPTFLLLLLVLIVMIIAILVIIPINNAFSDAPNRLIGFYQSLLIFGGAYLVYKNFFKKKPSIESVVRNRESYIPSARVTNNDTWQQISKDERIKAFYSRIVDIIANYEQPQ